MRLARLRDAGLEPAQSERPNSPRPHNPAHALNRFPARRPGRCVEYAPSPTPAASSKTVPCLRPYARCASQYGHQSGGSCIFVLCPRVPAALGSGPSRRHPQQSERYLVSRSARQLTLSPHGSSRSQSHRTAGHRNPRHVSHSLERSGRPDQSCIDRH